MLTNKLTGAGGAAEKTYVEDVFSTYLYTGNGAAQTINNGIDLAGKGGLVWTKLRGNGSNQLFVDTIRGNTNLLFSDKTDAQISYNAGITSFLSDGYTLGTDNDGYGFNYSAASPTTTVSWTFRKAPKFFDVVTYTGTGVAGRTVAHSLGSVPGMIIIKSSSNAATNWVVYHRSIGATKWLALNLTNAAGTSVAPFNNTEPTSTNFTVGNSGWSNANGYSYVAYLFAHDTDTDGLIQCGSYTGNGSTSGPVVTLGWEPQYLMIKRTDTIGSWTLLDNMRGMPVGSNGRDLYANYSDAEYNSLAVSPTSTGFQLATTISEVNASGGTYIYMAIRRGPMKTPTDGTKVYNTQTFGGGGTAPPAFIAGFPVDLGFYKTTNASSNWVTTDRLRGTGELNFNLTSAESANSVQTFDYQNGYYNATGTYSQYRSWMFRRAPGFFDVVCYTGTGAARTVNHNLGVAPELMITKKRSATGTWIVNANITPSGFSYGQLNGTTAFTDIGYATYSFLTAPPTSTYWGLEAVLNDSGSTYVTYLFASCPGVSKVGSYTGTGANTTNQINCGFTNGARFVMIKKTSGTGDWFVFDTARGITSGTDPFLKLNATTAQTTIFDCITPYSAGFNVNDSSDAGINTSGATYIYLAIA